MGPTLFCDYCERDDFPNRKALRYHLFRIHQISMGRLEASKPTSSMSPAPSQVRNNEGTSPAEETSLANSAPSFFQSAGLRNHLAAHKKVELRDAAPKLLLPAPSIRKHKRRKRGDNLPPDISEPSNVSDPAAVLAQPVLQGDILACPDDSIQGPISHLITFWLIRFHRTVSGPSRTLSKTSHTFFHMALRPMVLVLPLLPSTLMILRLASAFTHGTVGGQCARLLAMLVTNVRFRRTIWSNTSRNVGVPVPLTPLSSVPSTLKEEFQFWSQN
ncbi:hypothetical protein CDAR_567241 [Caerostris darwini]|uniref:C2H2-type domain-containing protein n=1 Tax=Caerostris darwini TaxID=1538125 RepID=A0AAV4QVB7_9ARAC|nr:hypothetical protein CDAR_567241 [Caerostris darwini]